MACESDIDKILHQILPGFETRQNNILKGKLDRPDIDKLI